MDWLQDIGVLLLAGAVGAAIGISLYLRGRLVREALPHRIARHFRPLSRDQITIADRGFPHRVRADLQRVIDGFIDSEFVVRKFCGVDKDYCSDLSIARLLAASASQAQAIPPEYEEVDIGDSEPVRCLKTGLWLLESQRTKLAVLLDTGMRIGECGYEYYSHLQIATANNEEGARLARDFFDRLEHAVREAKSYRGKILSLESGDEYAGTATGIKVHRLQPVAREQVILPTKTLDLLDRNLIQFVGQRAQLARLRMATKKGVLFYGPPGTGKTYTVHYLAGSMEGHTTLLISAEQVGLLSEYMTLARLLQPSIVVIEDVDLIGRERTSMRDAREEVLLNKLLNEMDGLKQDAEILFVLTTNRPEVLEEALASRPGRIDQAIEFPLPDEAGRGKLIRLYARGMEVPPEVVRTTVKKTEKVSAAFIKELMRRSAQFHLECNSSPSQLSQNDVDRALEELLVSGGSLNRMLLGAQTDGRGEEAVAR